MAATLYVIATPIGNLEDVTHRAVRILKEVNVIFCEDTRITKRLCDKYGITTRLMSLNARTERGKAKLVLTILSEDKDVALVTDAGTPGISDPGSFVVSYVREESPATPIVAVPGPSALTAAFSIAGITTTEFLFLGFLPHKKGRQTLHKEIGGSERAVVIYESPHRIGKLLHEFAEFGSAERKVTVARELTKIYEEVVSGTPAELTTYFDQNDKERHRGEFVVIVHPKS
jgi:16S rRNA (cytidine1402-2'-O)-methyltransferase